VSLLETVIVFSVYAIAATPLLRQGDLQRHAFLTISTFMGCETVLLITYTINVFFKIKN
jgi:hypothetical protein